MTVQTPPESHIVPVEFRIVSADVYARGALVTYSVTLPEDLPKTAVTLMLSPLSPDLEPASVRAMQEGSRHVRSVFVQRHTPLDFEPPHADVALLRTQERTLEQLNERHKQLRSIHATLLEHTPVPTFYTAHSETPQRDPATHVQDTAAAFALIQNGVEDVQIALLNIEREQRQLQKKLEVTRLHVREAPQRTTPSYTALCVALSAGDEPLKRLNVACVIPSARWWPAYTIRLDSKSHSAQINLDSWVGQASAERWENVALSFSTAQLVLDARLPKLPSLRYGRSQAKPPSTGFRPPPNGLASLFHSYDEALSTLCAPPSALTPPYGKSEEVFKPSPVVPVYEDEDDMGLDDDLIFADEVALESVRRPEPKASGLAGSLARAFQSAPASAPRPKQKKRADETRTPSLTLAGGLSPKRDSRLRDQAQNAYKEGSSEREYSAQDSDLSDLWLHFDALVLRGRDAPNKERGTLGIEQPPKSAKRAQDHQNLLQHPGPMYASDPNHTRGSFDHMFRTDGVGSVPGDGTLHRVQITSEQALSHPRWRCVASEDTTVYREVVLENPFKAPLLSGPVDILVDGAMVAKEQLEHVDRGGEITFGLGEEHDVRVTRDVRVREHTEGIFKGTTAVSHQIDIEVRSSLDREVTLELIDRAPHSDDDDISIELHNAQPAPKTYTQRERGHAIKGGLLWSLKLPARGRTNVRWGYTIKLPSKYEIGGGNRRD